MVVLLLALAFSSQAPAWGMPPTRLHIHTSESVNPDVLRGMASEFSVVWLHFRGDVLKESSIDSLKLFRDAWISGSGQVSTVLVRQIRRVPHVGIEWQASASDWRSVFTLGPRRRALIVNQWPSDGDWQNMKALQLQMMTWQVSKGLDVLSLASLHAVPGQKMMPGSYWSLLADQSSCRRASAQLVFLVDDFALQKFPVPSKTCQPQLRVRLHGVPTPQLIRRVFFLSPFAEFELELSDAPESAGMATKTLELFKKMQIGPRRMVW